MLLFTIKSFISKEAYSNTALWSTIFSWNISFYLIASWSNSEVISLNSDSFTTSNNI
jgi:hypothetical protein